jgi:hypothetical protein
MLDAIFNLSREEIVRRVQSGALKQKALDAHDYVYDIFAETERERTPVQIEGEALRHR